MPKGMLSGEELRLTKLLLGTCIAVRSVLAREPVGDRTPEKNAAVEEGWGAVEQALGTEDEDVVALLTWIARALLFYDNKLPAARRVLGTEALFRKLVGALAGEAQRPRRVKVIEDWARWAPKSDGGSFPRSAALDPFPRLASPQRAIEEFDCILASALESGSA